MSAEGRVWLVGFMASGKTSVGRALAAGLGEPFVDLDRAVEEREGTTASVIFETRGEEAFRAAEREALAEAAGGPAAVIAAGGGAVLDEANRALMRETGTVVYLRVSAASAVARAGERSGRPLLDGPGALERAEALLQRREPLYESVADIVIDTEGRDPRQLAEDLAAALAGEGRSSSAGTGGAFMLRVETASASYDVRVGPGMLEESGPAVAALGARAAVVVSDENVASLFGARVSASLREAGVAASEVLVPAGETSKSWERAGRVLSEIVRSGLDRTGAVVALGGGVVGDLAGFCASVYMRGVPVVQLPTTLLAQVDSAIGGKTGVDLPAGKNLAGTFWQPAAVLADTSTLPSLQESEWRSGLAEVVKSAALAGEPAMAALEADAAALESREERAVLRVVRMAAGLKARVVGGDEREGGARESLNYGHTLGHALEAVLGYGAIPHGHAVAEGIRFAARLAERLADAEPAVRVRQEVLLDVLGLERLEVRADTGALLRAMASDKKARGGEIRFVLVPCPGEWRTVTVAPEVIAEELERFFGSAS